MNEWTLPGKSEALTNQQLSNMNLLVGERTTLKCKYIFTSVLPVTVFGISWLAILFC